MKKGILLAFLLAFPAVFGWIDPAWQYRALITVNNSGSALTDYQVAVSTTNFIYNNTGLVASWHFSEGTGTRAADSSGNGNDGTLTNGPMWVAGKFGNALRFNGLNTYVALPAFSNTGQATYSAWVNITSLGSNFIFEDWAGSTGAHRFYLSPDGKLHSDIRWNTISGYKQAESTNPVASINAWKHYTVTINGSVFKMYVDGAEVPVTITYDGGAPAYPISGTGANIGGRSGYFNGTIDEVRVYSRALSSSEIAALYNASRLRLDYADLRFTNSSDSSLPYWLESDNRAWVKVPYIPGGASNIYAYYGNPAAADGSSEAATYYVSNRKFDYLPVGRNWTCSATGNGACNAALTGDSVSSPYSGYVYETARGCTRAHLQQNITLPDMAPLYLHYSRRYYCNTWGGPLVIKINATTNDWSSGTILRSWGCGGGGTTSPWAEFWDDVSAYRGKTVMIEAAYHDSNDNDPTYCGYGDHGAWLRVDDFFISTVNASVSIPQALAFGQEEVSSPAVLLAISPASKATYPNYNESFTLWVYNNQTIPDSFALSCTGTCSYSENPVVTASYQNKSVVVTITGANVSGTTQYTITATSQANASNSVPKSVFLTVDTTKWRDQWSDAYGNAFRYRIPVTVTNNGAALTDYQVNLTIDTASIIATGKMRGDCGDIRVTNGTNGIPFWTEPGCNTSTTRIWAKLPSIPAGNSTVYVYYGSMGAAGAASFDSAFTQPNSVAGLRLWLKADAITGLADGAPVGTWPDSSGNGYSAVQATASRQPAYKANVFNGKPALRFTASASQTINVNTNFPAPFTVLYVARQNGPTRQRVLSGLNNNWLLGWWGGAKRQAYFDGWISPSGTPAADSNVSLYSATGTGSLSTFYENGNQLFSNAAGLTGPNGIAVGYLGGSEFSDADIAEIIIYNSVLSATDRGKIERNLAAKYGLAVAGYVSPEPTSTLLIEEASSLAVLLAISPASKATYPNYNESFTLWVYNNQSVADNFTLSCSGTCYYSENPVVTAPRQNKSVVVAITSPNASGTAMYVITAAPQANASWSTPVALSLTVDASGWRDQWHDAYGNAFRYRIQITLTNDGASAIPDYKLNVTMDTASLIAAGKMRADCGDIRFMNITTGLLPYWAEPGCNATNTSLWAKIPYVLPGINIIYLYYGNPAATSLSNQSAVCPGGSPDSYCYEFYDDFSDNDYTTNPAWTVGGSSYSASGGYLTHTGTFTGLNLYSTQINVTPTTGLVLEFDSMWTSTWCIANGVYLSNASSTVLGGGATICDYSSSYTLETSSASVGNSTAYRVPTSTWNHFKVTANNSVYTTDYGYGTKTVATYGPSMIDVSKISIGGWQHVSGSRFDNIRVRKFASPEPAMVRSAEQKPGYRILVRRCGLKQQNANVSAYYAGNSSYANSCLSNQYGICPLEISVGTYDLRFTFADSSTAWKNGTVFG